MKLMLRYKYELCIQKNSKQNKNKIVPGKQYFIWSWRNMDHDIGGSLNSTQINDGKPGQFITQTLK